MSVSNHLAIERWRDRINRTPAELAQGRQLSMDGRSVFATGDDIYSYGTHFCMAEIHRNKDGSCAFVLVNGDTYSVTTSGHQSEVRGAIGGRAQTLIVPFSALASANVDRSSIRPLEIVADTFTESTAIVAGAHLRRTHAIWDAEASEWRSAPLDPPEHFNGQDWECPPEVAPGKWEVKRYRHWLGESVFEATVSEERTRAPNASEREQIERAQAWHRLQRELQDEYTNAYRATDNARRAGYTPAPFDARRLDAALVELERCESQRVDYPAGYSERNFGTSEWTAQIRWTHRRRARFISAFDRNETGQLYFLAELPRKSKAATVETALDDLAPAIVKRALAQDIAVKRQGDVFAIPCHLPAEIKRPAPFKRTERLAECRLLGTDHTASEVLRPSTGEIYARGVMRHEPSFRRPDHARVKLDGWHLIVQNTVPRDTRG